MKKETVFKKLGNFKSVQKTAKQTYFYSRNFNNRYVIVIKQENSIFCLAIKEDGGQHKVVFHAKTIKSLVNFLEGK